MIGNYAFDGCEALQEIVIPEGVTSIGDGAFFNCNSLQKVVIPESVTLIGEYAFFGCGELQDIIIPESVTSMGEGAFNDCGSLKHVFIPKELYLELDIVNVFNVRRAGLFYIYSFTNDGNGTASLKSIDLDFGKVFLNVVPNENFEFDEIYRIDLSGPPAQMGYDYENGEVFLLIPESEMNNLFIYATFKRISATVAFCSEDGTNILQSGTYKINEIPSYTADIPVKEPDGDNTYVFAGWSDGTVTYGVDDQLPAVTDDVIYTAVFEEVCTTITGTCSAEGDNLTWTLDDEGTLTISGTGEMGSWYSFSSPWCNYTSEIKKVVIGDGVTGICDYAFLECYSLQKVVIPESVTSIGENAFLGCGELQDIIIPESVTSIGEGAFNDCGSLKHVFIPKELYLELDIVNVFNVRRAGLFYIYSFTNDGNGTASLKSIDLDFGKVFLNVVPNENFEFDEIYRIDLSGPPAQMGYDYENGEVFLLIPESEMNNLFIYATFKRISATVAFCSEDGTNILQSGTYKINEIPSYTADIPVKEPDGDTTYVFAGWSDGTVTYGINDQLPKVTDDVTYTAVFEEVPQSIPPVSLYKLSSIEGEDKRADIIFRINRNEDDENCISYFRSVAVDDVVLANGTQYSVEKGSTVITLKSDYLKTLSEGEHTITVNFKDGAVTASFNNLKREAESIPATGETAIKATVGVVLVLAAVSGLAVVLIKRKKKSEK